MSQESSEACPVLDAIYTPADAAPSALGGPSEQEAQEQELLDERALLGFPRDEVEKRK